MQSLSNFDWVGKTVIWVGLAHPCPCLEPALLDTAIYEQPASLAINVSGLPSLWRVSMIVFWTTVKSAVFPVIV